MSVWTALVVVSTMIGTPPAPVVNATSPGPMYLGVSPGFTDNGIAFDPNITMTVKPTPGTQIGRMTGVEADTYVNAPVVTTLGFPYSSLCEAAAVILRKQAGVYSVSCVQTGF